MNQENLFTETHMDKVKDPTHIMPPCILVDMDGTLCHREGFSDRDPYDWSRASEDGVDTIVKDIVHRFSPDHTIIIFTARPAKAEIICRSWLKRNGIEFDHIFTRADNDMREDSIVKWEMFQEHVEPHWSTQFILDDMTRVVDMWRANGLKCLQVASGDF